MFAIVQNLCMLEEPHEKGSFPVRKACCYLLQLLHPMVWLQETAADTSFAAQVIWLELS